jgi:hypothetical protein
MLARRVVEKSADAAGVETGRLERFANVQRGFLQLEMSSNNCAHGDASPKAPACPSLAFVTVT